MKSETVITNFGLFSTLAVSVIGIGVFSYPRELNKLVGRDGWVVILVMGIITMVVMKLITKAMELNGYKELTVIAKSNMGSFLGSVLMVIISISNILVLAVTTRVFIEVVKMNLLEKTPTEFLIIITIVAGVYLVSDGFGSVVKLNEISFWIMFIPFIIILMFTLKGTDFTNLLPVLTTKPQSYLQGLSRSIFYFGGLEVLYLALPYRKDKTMKTVLYAILFVIFFYLIVFIFTIAVFTTKEVSGFLWPTIIMVKVIDIPGTFIERWDGVVMSLWIIFYFSNFSNGFVFSTQVLSESLFSGRKTLSAMIFAPVIYFSSLYFNNIPHLLDIAIKFIPAAVILNTVILPIILIMTRKKSMKGRTVK